MDINLIPMIANYYKIKNHRVRNLVKVGESLHGCNM